MVNYMYIQHIVEIFYLGLVTLYIMVIVLFIYLTSRGRGQLTDGGSSRRVGMEREEKRWMYTLIAIAIIGNVIFLSPILPSISYKLYLDEEPVRTIIIRIEDHEFILPENPIRIRVGELVEFKVYSGDLTYGFGVFRDDGTMVFQMQVVPYYENSIVWVFDEPGVYTIRSTEYSGPEHPFMVIYDAIIVEEGG